MAGARTSRAAFTRDDSNAVLFERQLRQRGRTCLFRFIDQLKAAKSASDISPPETQKWAAIRPSSGARPVLKGGSGAREQAELSRRCRARAARPRLAPSPFFRAAVRSDTSSRRRLDSCGRAVKICTASTLYTHYRSVWDGARRDCVMHSKFQLL